MLSIICILGKNRAIGINNNLIWNIPNDLKHFKQITSGHPIIMGRKTFESIGKPLQNRKNIIITRNKNYKIKGCYIAYSLNEAIKEANNSCFNTEIFIIGGGEIYKQAICYADKLYLTIVEEEPKNADTFFPDYSKFKNIVKKEPAIYNNINYNFLELTK